MRTQHPDYFPDPTRDSMHYLQELLDEYEIRGSIAEIGYFRGEGSTKLLLNHVRSHGGNFYSMDLFPTNKYYLKAQAELCHSNTMAIKGPSALTGNNWTRENLDFLFIDGCHDFPHVGQDGEQSGVIPDILAWHDHLNIGGILAFHDYTGDDHTYGISSLLAVEHAVDSYITEPLYTPLGTSSTIKAFRKHQDGLLVPSNTPKHAPNSYRNSWKSLDIKHQSMDDFLIYGAGASAQHVLDCILEIWGTDTRVQFTDSFTTEADTMFGYDKIPLAEVKNFTGTIVIGSIFEGEIADTLLRMGKMEANDFYGMYDFLGWCNVGRHGYL